MIGYTNVKIVEGTVTSSDSQSMVSTSTFNMVAYNQTLSTYTVSGGAEVTLSAAYADKVIEVLDLSLFSASAPNVYTEYIAIISPDALLNQTVNNVANLPSRYLLTGKHDGYSLGVVINGTEYGQTYRWGQKDIGGFIQLGSTPKVSIVFTHTVSIRYTATDAVNYVSFQYR